MSGLSSTLDDRWVTLMTGPVRHAVKKDVLKKGPRYGPLGELFQHVKNGNGDHSSGVSNNAGGAVFSRLRGDALALPYALHYAATGDLIYPVHEGYARVDALLTTLTELGLVHESSCRNSKGSGGGGGGSQRQNRRRLRRDILSRASSSPLPSPTPLTKSCSMMLGNESGGGGQQHHQQQNNSKNSKPKLRLARSMMALTSQHADDGSVGGTRENMSHEKLVAFFLRKCLLRKPKDSGNDNSSNNKGGETVTTDDDGKHLPASSDGSDADTASSSRETGDSVSSVSFPSSEDSEHSGKTTTTTASSSSSSAGHSVSGSSHNCSRTTSLVFRPPPTKGGTLILVSTSSTANERVEVYGSSQLLNRVLPDFPAARLGTGCPQVDSVVRLDAETNTALQWIVGGLDKDLTKQGFDVTVRSQWYDAATGGKKQQWMLYRKNSAAMRSRRFLLLQRGSRRGGWTWRSRGTRTTSANSNGNESGSLLKRLFGMHI